MDRAYVSEDRTQAICCWNAPSKEEVETLFEKAHAPYESITPVEEMATESFA